MKTWLVVFSLTGALLGGVAQAEPIDGNTLLKACRLVVKASDGEPFPANQGVEFGYCLGLIQGVRSALMIHKDQLTPVYRICFPYTGITNEQAARIVVKYLDSHPELLNEDPALLTVYAYRDVYLCK
jgi:hypothetical protein